MAHILWFGPPPPLLPQPPNPAFVSRHCLPREGANQEDRLTCLMMNHLQKNLVSTVTDIFNADYRKSHLIYKFEILADSQDVRDVALVTTPTAVHIVHITIEVCKQGGVVDSIPIKQYKIDCMAMCFDKNRKHISVPPDKSAGGASLCMTWIADADAWTRDWDWMDFDEVLRLLRRSCYGMYDDFGTLRDALSAEECGKRLLPIWNYGSTTFNDSAKSKLYGGALEWD